jgi:hypothetical protein
MEYDNDSQQQLGYRNQEKKMVSNKNELKKRLVEALSDDDQWHGLRDVDDPSQGYWISLSQLSEVAIRTIVEGPMPDPDSSGYYKSAA